MTTLTIKKVNALPLTYTPNTMYLVKTATANIMEVYISSNDGESVLHISTVNDTLDSTVLFGDTPPSTDTHSKLWWNSAVGSLYVLYDDGTTKNWVEAGPTIAVPEFDGNGTASTMARSDHWHDTLVMQEAQW